MPQLVRLKYGESETYTPGGGIGGVQITKASAKVANIAFQKDVALHYRQSDGTWSERGLGWLDNFGDYDLFGGNFSDIVTSEFVVRYFVDGQTYWDNNGLANYHVGNVKPNVVGALAVILNRATARRGSEAGGGFVFDTSWTEGEIYVQNQSFNKRVGIRLTANDWMSFHDSDASFSGTVSVATGISDVEIWKFKTPELNLDESTVRFRFAVYYNNLDTGQWFWDNNFGHDYSLSKVDLSTLE